MNTRETVEVTCSFFPSFSFVCFALPIVFRLFVDDTVEQVVLNNLLVPEQQR